MVKCYLCLLQVPATWCCTTECALNLHNTTPISCESAHQNRAELKCVTLCFVIKVQRQLNSTHLWLVHELIIRRYTVQLQQSSVVFTISEIYNRAGQVSFGTQCVQGISINQARILKPTLLDHSRKPLLSSLMHEGHYKYIHERTVPSHPKMCQMVRSHSILFAIEKREHNIQLYERFEIKNNSSRN